MAELQTIESSGISNKYRKGQQYFADLFRSGALTACSPGMMSGYCPDGHKFLQSVQCGREYCPDCGKDGSPIHGRRFNKWMPKVRSMAAVGYLVITIPEELRSDFHNKRMLSDFRTLLRKKLVRMGYKRGLMRWHYFGDCPSCNGKGCQVCNDTGAGRKWNPHLNVIIEEGYIKDLKQSEFDAELIHWLSGIFKRLNGGKSCHVVYHYSYRNTEEMQINMVKYVTRSTFRIYHAPTAKMLYKFRSTSTWGNFAEEYTSEEALDNGCCPMCNKEGKKSKVFWLKLDCKLNYTNTNTIHLKNGNYLYLSPQDHARSIGAHSISTKIKGRARPQIKSPLRLPGHHALNRSKLAGEVESW